MCNTFLKLILLVVFFVGVHGVSPAHADHGDGEEVTHHATTVVEPVHTHESEAHALSTHGQNQEQIIAVLTKLIALLKEKQSSEPHEGHMDESTHTHTETVELVASVTLSAQKGMMGNIDLHAETTGFTFAPQHADKAHVVGEGHAHVMIDGTKAGRMYGPWLYVPALSKGSHTIEVSLATNDHKAYVSKGEPITDTVTIVVE